MWKACLHAAEQNLWAVPPVARRAYAAWHQTQAASGVGSTGASCACTREADRLRPPGERWYLAAAPGLQNNEKSAPPSRKGGCAGFRMWY